MMRRLLDRSRWLVLLLPLVGTAACTPATRGPAVHGPIATQGPIQVAPVADDQLAGAVHQLLLDGSESPQRISLLVGVVRRMFARAAERFDSGDSERGLATVTGALYLVRSGELRVEMFDANAALAFSRALELVAPTGDEARSMAFLNLQAASLPKDSPEQAQILEHLRAMQSWLRDTRQRSDVENSSLDQRAFGELSVLQPGPETLKKGAEATERWIAASIDFNAEFKPGVDNPRREQLMEAYRGIRTGALVLAALFLRHGDAAGASEALGRGEVRRVTPPGLVERLDSAANATDPLAWRELAGLYSSAMAASEENVSIPPEIARGAAWGAMVEAYRRSPHAVETAVPLAEMLLRFGVPEAGMTILADAAKENKNASITAGMLGLVLKYVLFEDRSQDAPSARRVFRAAEPILSLADALPDHGKLQATPAQVRFAMAAVELRAGDLGAGRALLEQGLKEQSSVHAWNMLAEIQHQAGDDAGALQSLTRALSAPDSAGSPLARADLQLLAFRIHRAAGSAELARKALEAATAAAVDAAATAAGSSSRAGAQRLIARVATQYGDKEAASRAVQRAFEAAGNDKSSAGMVAVEAASDALLLGDVELGRTALRRATELDIDDEDLVYVALWVQLAERMSPKKPASDDTTQKALDKIKRGSSWSARLADWGAGKLDDQGLMAKARDLPQRTEAAFYVAMRKLASGDKTALDELSRGREEHGAAAGRDSHRRRAHCGQAAAGSASPAASVSTPPDGDATGRSARAADRAGLPPETD